MIVGSMIAAMNLALHNNGSCDSIHFDYLADMIIMNSCIHM